MRLPLLAAAALLSLAACAAPSRAQRVQEAAYELNMGLRFGRTALALEKVSSDARKDFLRRHRDWSGRVRIVDLEMAGLDVREDEADVFVQVSWQNIRYSDVFTTVVHQRWKDQKGTWLLASELRAQGDPGLFGDEDKDKTDDKPTSERPREVSSTRTP